jgi:hypothetical protein
MARTPSFVRDPEQAAELAALLRDSADEQSQLLGEQRTEMTRRELTAAEQTIARHRRWADELEPEAEQAAPLHIRPRREPATERAEATG